MAQISRRRLGLLTLGVAMVAGSVRPHAAPPLETALGAPEAPVTMIEYSSLTCPHCARFHNDICPALRERYIDTGKVQIIFRDFPLNEPALDATVIAHCGGPDRYVSFVDVLFKTQANWSQSEDYLSALKQLAKLGGLSDEKVDACLQDQALIDSILQVRQSAAQEHQVRSTPTFVINDKVYPGNRSIDDFAAIIDPLVDAAS